MLGIILETMYQFETHQSNLRMRIRMSRKSIGYIVTCIFLSLLIGTPISVGAQPIPSLQVLCDTTDNPQQAHLPDPFPGIFYRVLFPDDTQSGYILEQVSQNGIESFPIPIPSEWNGEVTPSEVSPDGRYQVIEPSELNVLAVWKIGTSEIAMLSLGAEEMEALRTNVEPYQRQDNKLVWTSPSTLELRYLDFGQTTTTVPLATRIITVTDSPLTLTMGPKVDVPYPAIPLPPNHRSGVKYFSPQMQYVILSSREIVTGRFPDSTLQVYETATQTLRSTILPDLDGGPSGHPVWRPNEDRFFVLSNDPIETLVGRSTIMEVRVDQGFQQNTSLQQALFAQFGSEVSLDRGVWPIFSPSGNLLMFSIRNYATMEAYLVVQNMNTGVITAICTPTEPVFEVDRIAWSPDETLVGYRSTFNDQVIVYHVTNGTIYRIPVQRHVGWLSTPDFSTPMPTETPTSTPTVTPTETPTPTSTPTNTPTPTPTFTPTPTPGTPPQAKGRGLRAAYFDNGDFTGLKFYRLDGRVNFTWNTAAPNAALAADTFSLRWVGQIEAPATGSYTFRLRHDNVARLWINGQQVITGTSSSQPISLVGGMKVPIQVEYVENAGLASVILEWIRPGQTVAEVVPASALYAPS
jgi:PA14 domain